MRWAENEQSGWVDQHMEAYVNIAGPVLGVPKAVSACLSGQSVLRKAVLKPFRSSFVPLSLCSHTLLSSHCSPQF